MADYVAENLLRLMAAEGLSLGQVAQRTGVDQRTVRAILGGTKKPHARTLHRLARGLAVSIDEFFFGPSQLLDRAFGRQTDSAAEGTVADVSETNRKRELHEKLDRLMESSQAELIATVIDLAHRQVVDDEKTTSQR